jgi:hypothetical protein
VLDFGRPHREREREREREALVLGGRCWEDSVSFVFFNKVHPPSGKPSNPEISVHGVEPR